MSMEKNSWTTSIAGVCILNESVTLFLTVLIDNYDTNLTLSQTQTH